MELNGAKIMKRYTDLDTNQQEIYLKIYDKETEIIEVLTGCGIYGEYFWCKSLINLEVVEMQDVELSEEYRYFYKGCIISFECERDEMNLTACIEGDIVSYIDAGYADSGNDIVRENIKKALEKAKEIIDDAILKSEEKSDRDKLIELMRLPSNIRSLPKKEQNKMLIESIKKVNVRLGNIEGYQHYELSSRQKTTKNNAIKNITEKEYLNAYYEIIDFVDDYGDRHDGKIFNIEKIEIFKLIRMLYSNIKK